MTKTTDNPAQPRRRGRPRSSAATTAPEPVKGLDTGLTVLRALAAERRATLSNLALSADVSPATTYRTLTTFARHGFVEFDERTQEWAIGIEAFRTGAAFLAQTSLVELARPAMTALMHDTRETANLGVADGVEVVFLAQIEARHPVRAFHEVGSRGALHASGIGKALLAQFDEQAMAAFIESSGLPQFNDATLIEPSTLMQDLETTRQRRWSLDDEERHDGMRCVASAIFDADGLAVAGVSISGPSARFPDDRLESLGQRVCEAASEISRRLGGQGLVSATCAPGTGDDTAQDTLRTDTSRA